MVAQFMEVFSGFGWRCQAAARQTKKARDSQRPWPTKNRRIAVLEVNPGQAQVHGGLFAGLVERHQQARGLGLVFGVA